MSEKYTADNKAGSVSSNRTLGKADLYALAIGQVIGAGIVSVLGSAIAATGRSAWLAYLVAIVIGFVVIVPFLLLSSVARLHGGMYSLVGGLLGEKWAGAFIMCYIPNAFSLSIYGVSLGAYANSLNPGIDPRMVAIAITVIFYITNMMSVKGIATIQKPMTWILIASLVMFILFGFAHINASPVEFSSPEYFTNGSSGFVKAVILLIYSTTSYYMCINFGGNAKNAKKDIPLVMLTVPLLLVMIYCGAGIVAGCVMPISEVAGKPLTLVAKTVLPSPLFILFIVGGVMMALCTSLNSQFGAFGRIYAQGAKDQWFPSFLNKVNKNDQASVILTVAFIITLIPIVTGLKIDEITNNIVLLTYISGLIPMFAVLKVPKLYPEAWKKSHLHMPDGVFYTIIVFCIIVKLCVTVVSASTMTPKRVIASLAAIVFCFGYAFWRSNSGKAKMDVGSFDVSD